MEKVLGYNFEGLIPNSWPSNAFLVNGATGFIRIPAVTPSTLRRSATTFSTLVIHDKAGERLLEACLPAAEGSYGRRALRRDLHF